MIQYESRPGTPILWQATGILLVSVLIGLAYNSASPLGLRAAPKEAATTPTTAATSQVLEALKPPTSAATTGYVNQTVSLSFEVATNSPAAAAPLPTGPTVIVSPQPVTGPAHVHLPSVRWPTVKAMQATNGIVLVDARLKPSFDGGHIPGALSLPSRSTTEELQAFAARYPKTTRFVVYCGSDSCGMSHELAERMVKEAGVAYVSEMPGGYAEYQAALNTP